MLAPLRRADGVVYAKRPFGGPEAVLAYLARYTHRVAIANGRLVAIDQHGVTFRWKDYRARSAGTVWRKTMTLTAHEFIRRFLLHVLPDGSTASGTTACSPPTDAPTPSPASGRSSRRRCQPISPRITSRSRPSNPIRPMNRSRMILAERFAPGSAPRTIIAVRIDTS